MAAVAAPAFARLGADPCPPPDPATPALICPIVIASRAGDELKKRKQLRINERIRMGIEWEIMTWLRGSRISFTLSIRLFISPRFLRATGMILFLSSAKEGASRDDALKVFDCMEL
jgi:hypothetical protein